MPIVLLPGIVAILADSELVFLAMSSDKLIIFETLTPAAGSNSFKVTTGPWLTCLIFPLTQNLREFFLKIWDLVIRFFRDFLSLLEGVFNKSKSGNLNLVVFLLFTFSLYKRQILLNKIFYFFLRDVFTYYFIFISIILFLFFGKN